MTLADDARYLQDEGFTPPQIAERLSLPAARVERLLSHVDTQRGEAQRLRDRGLTYEQIASTLHKSTTTVHLWLNPEAAARRRRRDTQRDRCYRAERKLAAATVPTRAEPCRCERPILVDEEPLEPDEPPELPHCLKCGRPAREAV